LHWPMPPSMAVLLVCGLPGRRPTPRPGTPGPGQGGPKAIAKRRAAPLTRPGVAHTGATGQPPPVVAAVAGGRARVHADSAGIAARAGGAPPGIVTPLAWGAAGPPGSADWWSSTTGNVAALIGLLTPGMAVTLDPRQRWRPLPPPAHGGACANPLTAMLSAGLRGPAQTSPCGFPRRLSRSDRNGRAATATTTPVRRLP